MPSKQITLKDIAQKTGLHITTVSGALRGQTRFPPETRKRVQDAADALGYRPDPMLKAFSRYRTQSAKTPPANIAFLTKWPAGTHRFKRWGQNPIYRTAQTIATKQNIHLERFSLSEPEMTEARANEILKARGITALIIPSGPADFTQLNLDWSHFSVICIGDTFSNPQFHRVVFDPFQATFDAVHRLKAMGYRRIGMVAVNEFESRVRFRWLGGFQAAIHTCGARTIPPLILKEPDSQATMPWLKKYKPDVIIGTPELYQSFINHNVRIPEKFSFLATSRGNVKGPLTHIGREYQSVARTAMQCLINMIGHNERGIPQHANTMIVNGAWVAGNTIR